jgi:hypothetical protein
VGLLSIWLSTPALAVDSGTLVIGQNLKVGMFLKEAMDLLGVPNKIRIDRGSDPSTDSVVMEYPELGVVLHTQNQATEVDEIEVLPGFKGKLDTGIHLGATFNDVVEKYGPPVSYAMNMARYPDKGMYLMMNKGDQKLVALKIFKKGSKLLDQKLTGAAAEN